MPEKRRPGILFSFLIRAVLGMGIIFFANQYMDYRGISVSVGMNGVTFLTSGFLGLPGVALLYGIVFYQSL